jgi:hypothetical protein
MQPLLPAKRKTVAFYLGCQDRLCGHGYSLMVTGEPHHLTLRESNLDTDKFIVSP